MGRIGRGQRRAERVDKGRLSGTQMARTSVRGRAFVPVPGILRTHTDLGG